MFLSKALRPTCLRAWSSASTPPCPLRTWRPPPSAARVTPPSLPRRRAKHTSAREAARALFKEYPFSMTLASFFILCGSTGLLWTSYYYKTYILDAFHAFPPPVAAKLRRALWYANQDVNPAEAMKYYKQTLEVADEVGMDSLGDEILGVKISLAAFLERLQIYPKAIEVLELVRRDCLAWIEQRGGLQGNEAKRTRLLAKAIAIAVKQGELYANRYVGEKEAAEECLVWAVEAALRERRRRDQLGVKDGEAEGEWMTDEQIGAALEALANHFEEKDLHYLAAPLYLQAIAMIPWSNCHAAILMNNLSASLVQQTPPPYEGGPPPATRSELINSARSWALKAIEVSHRIKRLDGRTEECDVGCAVATHNLGEFEEMHGNIAEARRRYQEAKGLAKAVGFKEGIENADKGLERLRGKE